MTERTCSADDCEKVVLSRGLCVTHYHRWHRTVHSAKTTSRLCKGCGAVIERTAVIGSIAHYCGTDCRPRCDIEGCEKPRHGDVYCTEHHTRWKRTGDPLTPLKKHPNVGACSVDGCDQPMRKMTWCASHYAQQARFGEIRPWVYRWADEGGQCVVCGSPVQPGTKRRKHCSNACQVADSRAGGTRPTSAICDFCGKAFDLGRSRTGRLQRVDTKWCPDCGRESPDVQRFRRYGITREQYEAANAEGCRICWRKDRKLHVDHDHSCCSTRGGSAATCGRCVRGLICGPCNRALGLFADDPGALLRAAEYLMNPRLMP